MRTNGKVSKIRAISPRTALLKSKKGQASILVIIGGIAVALASGYGIYSWVTGHDSGSGDALSQVPVTTPGGEKIVNVVEKDVMTCDGVQSVNALYNDINFYKIGTDPNNKLEILSKDGSRFLQQVDDDATGTSVPVMSSFKALAGNTAGTPASGYFAEEIEFSTVCSDVPIQPKLMPSAEPTITIVNDNGVQQNSDSNDEAMDASSKYSPTATVKSDAEACAARYGAVVVFEYDATNISKISSPDLEDYSTSFLYPHAANYSGTEQNMDQYKIMLWDKAVQDIDGDGKLDKGYLCDGKKTEFTFTVETTSNTPHEDGANVKVHWYPINKDIDADKYTVITGIYDEDNNVIATGNTSQMYYAS